MWGEEVRRLLDLENVDLAGVFEATESTAVLSVVDSHGDHGFIGRLGKGSLDGTADIDEATVRDAAVLFTSGYALQELEMAAVVLDAFAIGPPGRWTVLDPGPAFDQVDPEIATRCLAETDVMVLTEDELDVAFDGSAAAILQAGPRHVVVERGSAGCVVHDVDGVVSDVAGHAVVARDTAAAGDSFAAGFTVGLRRGWPLPDCAALANAVGAAKVQKVGTGRSVPTMAEVCSVIAEFGVAAEL
jgi:sugar/nucleoside kinase (ribokinase family)